ncbi:MAG: hypothetical protein V4712_18365 [Pseudomonadota bacterium]
MKEGTRQLVAFFCLLGAATLGSLTYVTHYWLFFSQARSFIPDLVSGLIAVALLRPLLVGDFHHNHRANMATWVNFSLLFYVTAIFANIGLGGDTSWFKTLSSILAVAVIGMANLNCQRYGELVVPILLLFGAINISYASSAMGVAGFALLILALVGTMLVIDMGKVKDAMLSKPAI